MACRIDKTTIYLTRGDSLILNLILSKAGKPYTPAQGDVITFALKRDRINPQTQEFFDKDPLIQKTIPNNTLILELAPNDTKSLSFKEKYKYDIQITYADGKVDTFVEDADFVLNREVH